MKNIFTISSFIFLSVVSCKNSQSQSDKTNETPNALQNNSSSIELLSKSRNNDLAEDLYGELIDKAPELKDIENRIANINKSQDDSTESFNQYNNKIQSYFNSASTHIVQIKDSSLNERMRTLIFNSLTNYNMSISTHSKLIEEISAKTIKLNDLHTILKITRTLPIIIKYQINNKPSTLPLEGFKREIDKALKLVDNGINK